MLLDNKISLMAVLGLVLQMVAGPLNGVQPTAQTPTADLEMQLSSEAFVQLQNGNLREARRLTQLLLQKAPRSTRGHWLIVQIDEQPLTQLASAFWVLSGELKPPAAWRICGQWMTRWRFIEPAYRAMLHAYEGGEVDGRLLSELAELAQFKHRKIEALEWINKAIEIAPEVGILEWMKADIHVDSGRYELAFDANEAAIRKGYRDARMDHQRAGILKGLGRHEESIEPLQRFLKGSPDNVDMLVLLADTYTRLDRPQEAKRVIDQIFGMQPDHPIACNILLQIARKEGDPAQIRQIAEKLRRANRIKQENDAREARSISLPADVLNSLARSDWPAADEALKELLKVDKNLSLMLERYVAFQRNRNAKIAPPSASQSSRFLTFILDWQDRGGKIDEMIPMLEFLIHLRPAMNEAIFLLAYCHLVNEDRENLWSLMVQKSFWKKWLAAASPAGGRS